MLGLLLLSTGNEDEFFNVGLWYFETEDWLEARFGIISRGDLLNLFSELAGG